MQAIQEITRQTAEGTRATGEAVSRLAKLAANLRQSVAGFKLPDTSFTSRG
jgi:twitching motility protein PilJ